MSDPICRIGILGTAGIARKNWKAIRLSGKALVGGVASRSLASAERFIDECSAQVPCANRPQAFGSYQALLDCPDIDAVYIPLPTSMRHEWVMRAARAGKHVLGEKPAASSVQQVEEMLEACRQNSVQYMDGVMFMHSQRLAMVRGLLDDPQQLGTLRRLDSHFSFAGDDEFLRSNIRVNSDLEPFGCLGDLGWYCIRAFLWIMNGQLPREVRGRTLTAVQGESSPEAVPAEFSGELIFDQGVSAAFYCSFITQNHQRLIASGSKGYLRIFDFVLPFHGSEVAAEIGQDVFHVDNCVFHMENHIQRYAVREHDAGSFLAQEVSMIRHFADLVHSARPSPVWPEWTLKTQKVLDACLASSRQAGVSVAVV